MEQHQTIIAAAIEILGEAVAIALFIGIMAIGAAALAVASWK